MNHLKSFAAKLILEAAFLEQLRKTLVTAVPTFLLTQCFIFKINVNIEIGSSTVNCQLYHCRFQKDSAAKQTQVHCMYLICYHLVNFGTKKLMRSNVFAHLFSGLIVNTHEL